MAEYRKLTFENPEDATRFDRLILHWRQRLDATSDPVSAVVLAALNQDKASDRAARGA